MPTTRIYCRQFRTTAQPFAIEKPGGCSPSKFCGHSNQSFEAILINGTTSFQFGPKGNSPPSPHGNGFVMAGRARHSVRAAVSGAHGMTRPTLPNPPLLIGYLSSAVVLEFL